VQTLRSLFNHRFGFGSGGITRDLKSWIWSKTPKGATVVELGAGFVSTRVLSRSFNLISAEDNFDYIGLFANAKYVYAPINPKSQWYSLKAKQIPIKFGLMIIDGASGGHLHQNILEGNWIFERTSTINVDEAWRVREEVQRSLMVKG